MSKVRRNPEIGWRVRQALLGFAVAGALVGTTAANKHAPAESLHYSGTVSIDQSRQWFMTSAAGRGGVLHFGGHAYRFAITGFDCQPKRDALAREGDCLQFVLVRQLSRPLHCACKAVEHSRQALAHKWPGCGCGAGERRAEHAPVDGRRCGEHHLSLGTGETVHWT